MIIGDVTIVNMITIVIDDSRGINYVINYDRSSDTTIWSITLEVSFTIVIFL
jgi:hypothetical protein